MAFTPVTYNTGAAPGLDGPAFNAIETQYLEASLSFEPDLFTAWVYTGLTAAKDGTIANKLNLAAGTGFPLQTDGTLRQRKITAQSFTTSVINTTYFLDLNPDGTLSWGTAHSGTANYLPLCSVTTDAGGNISTVTDARVTTTTLLGSLANLIINILSVSTLVANSAGAAVNSVTAYSAAGGNAIKLIPSSAPGDAVYLNADGTGKGMTVWDVLANAAAVTQMNHAGLTIPGTLSAGGITTSGPVTLAAGNQETGKAGGRWTQAGAGSTQYAIVNFKATMTNTPTSITTGTADFTENMSGLGATFITKTGFALFWLITGAGVVATSWIGPYTTSGNCIRAVNAKRATFTHHCDICGRVRSRLRFTRDLEMFGELGDNEQRKPLAESRPGAYSIVVQCPCGAREMLTTNLTHDDELLTDLTPDGTSTVGEVARQVRALQRALKLPMID